MKKILFTTASTLGLALMFAGGAQAGDQAAIATQSQNGNVSLNLSGADSGALNRIDDNAFSNAIGVFNVGQNNGQNSLAQQGVAVAAILGCDCSNLFTVFSDAYSAAASSQTGVVAGNVDVSFVTATNNKLTDNAFSHAAGVFNVSQNNGSNSLMQQSVSVGAIVAN